MATETPNANIAVSAAIVHGLGLIALGIIVGIHYSLSPTYAPGLAIKVVAIATSVITIFWSLLLAYRSFAAKENSRWHLAIFLAFMLELTALCLLLWSAVLEPLYRIVNSAVWAGLPVFGPFVALTSMYAVPLAIRRARKINALESVLGIPGAQAHGAEIRREVLRRTSCAERHHRAACATVFIWRMCAAVFR